MTASLAPRGTARWRTTLCGVVVAATVTGLVGIGSTASAATLFTDDFNDGNSAGWRTNGGSWSVVSDGSPALRQSGTSSDARARAGSTDWSDYTVGARLKLTGANGSNRFAAVLARTQSATSYYFVALRTNNTVELNKLVGGSSTTLASAPMTLQTGTWYQVSLRVAGSTLVGSVAGGPTISASDSHFRTGGIGVATYYAAATFDDVTVNGEGPIVEPTTARPTTPGPGPGTPAPTTPGPGTPGPSTPAPSSPAPTSPVPSTPVPSVPVPTDAPEGFAGVHALGQNGTTGGAGGPTVTVSTTEQFLDYISRPGPYVIRVAGTIQLPTGTTDGMHNVSSDKTIIGVGSTAALVGGGLNIGLPVDDAVTSPPANAVHNIIIRNIAFSGATDDLLNVQMFSHHIWIDHNDFSNGDDGAVDIKRGSDFVTVSWNHFHDHDKTALLGHDESGEAQDTGRLRVTYHHNFFNRSDQRNPRVRFSALAHVYNNYYYENSYGIASTYNAGLFVEGNYFYSVNNPARVDFSGPLGRLVQRDNILVDCNHEIETNGTVPDPSTFYPYRADPASSVPSIVPPGAGVGKI